MMTNNELLKKISIAHNLKRTNVQELLDMSNYEMSLSQVNAFFAAPNKKNYEEMPDNMMFAFLNSLIVYSRGPKDFPELPPRSVLNSIQHLAETKNIEALDRITDCVQLAKDEIANGTFDEENDDIIN